MNFHKALAASLALALLSSVTMAAAAPHRAVHRGRAVFHLPNNTFCFQGDDQVAWIYTASSGNFIAGTDGYNYLPRGGTWKRDDTIGSCEKAADGVSYRTIVYFGRDNNPSDGQLPPSD